MRVAHYPAAWANESFATRLLESVTLTQQGTHTHTPSTYVHVYMIPESVFMHCAPSMNSLQSGKQAGRSGAASRAEVAGAAPRIEETTLTDCVAVFPEAVEALAAETGTSIRTATSGASISSITRMTFFFTEPLPFLAALLLKACQYSR